MFQILIIKKLNYLRVIVSSDCEDFVNIAESSILSFEYNENVNQRLHDYRLPNCSTSIAKN